MYAGSGPAARSTIPSDGLEPSHTRTVLLLSIGVLAHCPRTTPSLCWRKLLISKPQPSRLLAVKCTQPLGRGRPATFFNFCCNTILPGCRRRMPTVACLRTGFWRTARRWRVRVSTKLSRLPQRAAFAKFANVATTTRF